jgi:hypothetical protein
MTKARIFSLAAANELVPVLDEVTGTVIKELGDIRRRYESDAGGASTAPAWALEQVGSLLQQWSERVTALGGMPKGYFTVDFPSVDPELLYCWSYGEETISHTHKVWENFSHRRKIGDEAPPGDHLKWVN